METALLSGFEDYYLSLPDKTSEFGVVGTSGADKLTLSAVRLDLHLGDGPDSVVLPRLGRWNQAGVIDLGAGEDSLEAVARRVVGDWPKDAWCSGTREDTSTRGGWPFWGWNGSRHPPQR